MPRKTGITGKQSKKHTEPAVKKPSQPLRKRRTVIKDGPHLIDVHVGRRMRERRTILGLSQSHLAERVGLTFQQIQKYERGTNRISASRLWQLGEVLGIPVSWFFEELTEGASASDPNTSKTETLKLARYFFACPPTVRKQLAGLIKAASETC